VQRMAHLATKMQTLGIYDAQTAFKSTPDESERSVWRTELELLLHGVCEMCVCGMRRGSLVFLVTAGAVCLGVIGRRDNAGVGRMGCGCLPRKSSAFCDTLSLMTSHACRCHLKGLSP
jgi:hypothetical protein